jgi:hypothetical protein
MQTLTRPRPSKASRPGLRPPRRGKRFSPLMFIGIIVTVVVALIAGAFLVTRPQTGSHAAAGPNLNCSLIVPPQPLTAQGLATPYQLVATNRGDGPCHEANAGQSAFVQAAVIDPATGKISIYNPLVIDKGSKPAADPVVPQLPQGAIVGIWFGFNGANLTLRSAQNSLQDGQCVNGVNGSIFGQFAYCNAPAFFQAANKAIQAGKLTPPALGTARDGMICPTVRDFSIVDQDQSDNVTTGYLVTNNGRIAQLNAANIAKLPRAQILTNGSDNGLIDGFVDPALGCKPWTAPDLADPGQMITALPLDEIQAAAQQKDPIAFVPAGDPMVLRNDHLNLDKINAYREGVDQPDAQNLDMASTPAYCQNLLAIAPQRIMLDAPLTKQEPSPDAAAANTLFTFLAQRFNTSWGANGGLNCQGLLHQQSPIKVKVDDNGVAINATFRNGNGDGNGNNNGNGNGNGKNNGNGNGKNNQQGQQDQQNQHGKKSKHMKSGSGSGN